MNWELSINARKALNKMIVLLGVLICAVLVYRGGRIAWDFRNNLWTPAHLLVQGKSPYLIADLSPQGNAVWLPMAIGAFFPLGWLKLEQASMLWLIANLGAIVAMVAAATHIRRPVLWPFILGLLAFILYPRTIAHFSLGQFTIIATFLLFFGTQLVLKDRLLLAAILIAVAMSKPQLGVLVIPGLLVARWRSHGVQTLKFILYLGLSVLILVLPLFIGYREWISGYIEAYNRNAVWMHPSLLSLLTQKWGGVGIGIWAILFLGIFALNIHIWYTQPSSVAIYWGLALTPLVSPYIWSWDFVMALPLFVWTLARLEHYGSLVALMVGYVSIWILMFRVVLKTDGSDQHFWWGSWVMLILVATVWMMDKRLSGQRERFFAWN